MAQYNRLTNLKRKEVHSPDLEQDYHHLCSPNVAFTDMLYAYIKECERNTECQLCWQKDWKVSSK